MTLLTFLGKNVYQPTRYELDGRTATEGPFVAAALCEVLAPRPERVLVVATREAVAANAEALRATCPFEEVAIPSGARADELWEMFEAIAGAVPEGARLVIDITHGLRSQPMLALAVAQYLMVTKGVTVERILYGAFEARDPEANVTPVFDLTPFLDLARWSVAARQFTRDGRADALAALLAEVHRETYTGGGAGPRAEHTMQAGSALRALTDALAVVRPAEVLRCAGAVVDALVRVEGDLAAIPALRPLRLLLERVRQTAAPLRAASLFSTGGFRAQAAMIRFYLETGQLQQAVTLAREAVVSRFAADAGLDPAPLGHRQQAALAEAGAPYGRAAAEDALNALGKRAERRALELTDDDALAELWNRLAEIRNDVNHAGMRPEPLGPQALAAQVRAAAGRAAAWIAR